MLMWIILSSAFLAVFLLVRALFSKKIKSSAMYLLWILVAVRLLVPTYIPIELDLPVETKCGSLTTQIEAVEEYSAEYFYAINSESSTENGLTENTTAKTDSNINTNTDTLVSDTTSEAAISDFSTNRSDIIPESNVLDHPIQFVWFLGVVGFACYFTIVNLRFNIRLKRSRVLVEKYQNKVPVYTVNWLKSPCMTGILHPGIYINGNQYVEANSTYVLLHEYTHYRHKDTIWMLLQAICLCIHWFNPLVWLACYLFRKDCEYACDEAVAKILSDEDRISYSRTLLDYIGRNNLQNTFCLTSTSMSMEGKSMKKRVNNILQSSPKRVLNSLIAVVLTIVLFAGTFVVNSSENEVINNNLDTSWNITYHLDNTNEYWSFYPDGTFEISTKNADGTYTESESVKYEILNNHEIQIDNVTYQCLLESDGELVSLWEKDKDGTMHFTRVGPTEAISAYILDATMSYDQYTSVKFEYSVINNGAEESKIDLLVPIFVEYQIFIENTGFKDIENIDYHIIANNSLESLLNAHKDFTAKEEAEFYSRHYSILQTMWVNQSGVDTITSDGASVYTSLYKIGYTEESLERDNTSYNNVFTEQERKEITEQLRDITVVFTGNDKEIARIDFSNDNNSITSSNDSDSPHLSIEITNLTKDIWTEKEILNAMSVVVSEFQNDEGWKTCNLKEIRYVEDRTYSQSLAGKQVIVLDTIFTTGIFSGHYGLNPTSQYDMYYFYLEQTDSGWEIIDAGLP